MRKAISWFLVLAMLLLSGNMFAEGIKGADLIIQKKNGANVRGELIAVKQNSLLLMERDSGADVSVDNEDISVIKIVKKSKSVVGIGIGMTIGGAVGTLAGYEGSKVFWQFGARKTWAWIGGIIGLVSGALIGKALSRPETIQLEGKSDSEIQEIMFC